MKAAERYEPKIRIAADEEQLAKISLEFFVRRAEEAIRKKGVFYAAISGGNTPKRFFDLLGDSPKSRSLGWDKIQLFWVDERYVPPDSQWSNYKLAAETFLPRVDIPRKNVHRIPTGYCDFNAAARKYERTIKKVFRLKKNQMPVFDLIILGMGPEGHTGSLFPDSYAAFDRQDLAAVVYELDEELNRITLTQPVLCAAAHLVVMVAGEEKAKILKEVLKSEQDEVKYPIHILWPILNKVTWLVDKKAAKLL